MTTPTTEDPQKTALKALRGTRKAWIARAAARVKTQKKALKAIRERLAEGDATVPEIAEATGMPADSVLWYVAAMKKYGEIVEVRKNGGFFRYARVQIPAPEAP